MAEQFVVILGALDTKGPEVEFCREFFRKERIATKVIDTGVLGTAKAAFDVGRGEVAEAGGKPLEALIEANHRGEAIEVMGRGVKAILGKMQAEGSLAGVFGLGGSAGTSMAAAGMQDLPLGVPKIIVSTLASGNTRPYVGIKDIVLFNSVVDVAGINQISRIIFQNAAAAMVGMVKAQKDYPLSQQKEAKVVGMTMFGVTTTCVMAAKEYLENRGFEVLVFHATGTGGQTMEGLVKDGLIHGVLDITTTELADELVGGVLSAGPKRLEIMGELGVPHVISPGAMDMVNFGGMETIPDQFHARKLFKHNPQVTLMRTNLEENKELGRIVAEKVNMAPHNRRVIIPCLGFSEIDRENGPFGDAEADQGFISSLQQYMDAGVPFDLLDLHINDEEFAITAAKALEEMMK